MTIRSSLGLLLAVSIGGFIGLLITPSPKPKHQTCHHDGRLDHIDPKKTVRVDATRYVEGMKFEIGVCKICGVITDEKRVGATFFSVSPIAGATNVPWFIWNPDKEAQEAQRKSTVDFITRIEANTNTIVIKDSLITVGKLWDVYRDNSNRFVMVIGCTITAGDETGLNAHAFLENVGAKPDVK